jgi:hypothetical protein
MTRKAFINELGTEMHFRRKVWRKVPGSQEQFMEDVYNRRYQITRDMLAVFECMTDMEFSKFAERVSRKEAEALAQTSLF